MNKENFLRVLEHIEAHPETWVQESWHSSCGSAHCFAGHAQIMAGKPEKYYNAFEDAREFLDLTYNEADWLFDVYRTMEDFRAVAAHGFLHAMRAELDENEDPTP